MSIVLRGYDEGMIVTIGLGRKVRGLLKQYLIFKSYVTILTLEEGMVVFKDEEDIYVS